MYIFIRSEDEKEAFAQEDHIEAMKNLKYDSQQKFDRLREILTTPKQILGHKK